MKDMMLRFGKVELIAEAWYRCRIRYRTNAPTKTYYRLDSYTLHDIPTYIVVRCDGIKGKGKWYVVFAGELAILETVQNLNGTRTYYKTSNQAIKAATKLVAKMDKLKAFI